MWRWMGGSLRRFAEPLVRISTPVARSADCRRSRTPVASLQKGDEIRILDCSRGWAWGYGPDGRVGYVRSEFLVP